MSTASRLDATREVTSSVGVIVRLIASGQLHDARLCDFAFYRAAIRLAARAARGAGPRGAAAILPAALSRGTCACAFSKNPVKPRKYSEIAQKARS